jgi:hypothetical protein
MGMVSMATSSTVVIRRIDERELDGILSTIGASLAADGFVPKGSVSGLFVFEKKKEPNILVALVLLLLAIIPGIVYLFLGGEHQVVSIKVSEIPLPIGVDGAETILSPDCLGFNITAPSKIINKIKAMLSPYAVDVDRMTEPRGQVLVGGTAEKRMEVTCDHCGQRQEVTVTLRIDRVVRKKGYGPGGSITVTCSNPNCQKPFEVSWGKVVADIEP